MLKRILVIFAALMILFTIPASASSSYTSYVYDSNGFWFTAPDAFTYVDSLDMTDLVLPDGTDVTLSPGSSLSYKMKDRREVRMEGKAFFDVTRDEARPFEVDADGAFVRVLGTEFMVDVSDEDAAKVYVQDGKVLFARNEKAEGVVLTKGMSATLEAEADVPVMDEKPDANSIAWQRGTFIFDHTPLKDVLDCLSGYYHVSFAATDLSKELSGEFAADDLDLIIELIESALDVTIIRR